MSSVNARWLQDVERASNFIKAVYGWGRDRHMVVNAARGFRDGWVQDVRERKGQRALAFQVIEDAVSTIHCHVWAFLTMHTGRVIRSTMCSYVNHTPCSWRTATKLG